MKLEIFVLLFVVVSAVAIAARSLRVPYTVALVFAGLGMGAFHFGGALHLSEGLLFGIFLPGLIFEAAFHMQVPEARRDWLAILAMSTPGLLAAGALTAAILVPAVGAMGVDHFEWIHGVLFASVIGATDPIAVVALFRSLGAPARLATLVEAESLLNDGTGIVFFTIAAAAAAGSRVSVGGAALQFLEVAGLGAGIGAFVGYALSLLIRRIDDAMIEITLTVITAYGSFTLAGHLGGSGVIACVVAGLLCARHGARGGMSPASQVAVGVFWEYLAFAMNSVVFLLIGLEVDLRSLWAAAGPILAAYLAMTVARALVVYAVTGLVRRTRWGWPWSWSGVLSWSGLRGALSMVLVLGLAPGAPHRELLINMTFGVVLLSIILQGATMSPLLRRLGVTPATRGPGQG